MEHIWENISESIFDWYAFIFDSSTEDSHGDLGMISEVDSLFLFSWSGNIVDLVPMLSYANSFWIDVIDVTSNPECKLAKSSNIKIILPKVFEAGPHKLAAAYG